jgi:hypothetical protein
MVNGNRGGTAILLPGYLLPPPGACGQGCQQSGRVAAIALILNSLFTISACNA